MPLPAGRRNLPPNAGVAVDMYVLRSRTCQEGESHELSLTFYAVAL